MAQLDACLTGVIRRLRVQPVPGWQHSFIEIDDAMFSMVILSLLLIQEGQFISLMRKFNNSLYILIEFFFFTFCTNVMSCQFLAKECAQYWLTA